MPRPLKNDHDHTTTIEIHGLNKKHAARALGRNITLKSENRTIAGLALNRPEQDLKIYARTEGREL